MNVIFNLIGKRIREIRIQQNITQAALAEMSNLSISFICLVENGKKKASLNSLIRISNALGIISRDDFIATQRLISNAKYGNRGILPELHVIPEGTLKGYVSINPRWAGFKADDYRSASASINTGISPIPSKSVEIEANEGDFDLRGYEIARAQFFDTSRRISMTLSSDCIKFSTNCIHKLDKCTFVELLVNPGRCLIAIRPATQDNRNSIQWSRLHDGLYVPRQVGGAAFLPTLYELFGWKPSCKYRVIGIHKQKGNSGILLFDIHEVEILIPADTITPMVAEVTPVVASSNRKSILAYPADWASDFGDNYYIHSHPDR